MLAAALFEQGIGPAEVARRLGVTTGAASQWKRAWKQGGKEALRSVPHPGGRHKLPPERLPELETLLLEGPQAHGFPTELWTLRRVADLIERNFGVSYHISQVSRILHSMGWSRQKPQRQARERDQQQVDAWRTQVWPRIKRGL